MKQIFYFLAVLSFVFLVACKNETKKNNILVEEKEEVETKTDSLYKQKGLNIAFKTKAQLGKNLMGMMKQKGPLEALQYCNIKAIPLTDSMATIYHARIKRVSDKTRNPNNKANETELKKIEIFKNMLANGEKITPVVSTENDSVYFYYPIVTNDMCLKCHGTPNKEVDPKVLESLTNLYPDDNALGYSENQVRGIWSIRFKE